MAHYTCSCLVLCFLLLASLATRPVTVAGRGIAAAGKPVDKKVEKECLDQEGSFPIPGVGRYMPGSRQSIPNFTDLDHSGPAAANGQYIPGNDDTFVPNPGYEVPARG